MLERLLILLALVAAGAAVWMVLGALRGRRLRRLAAEAPFADIVPVGQPTVIAFTLPSCRECRSHQAPALERLGQAAGGGVLVHTLRADAHPALVDRLGIMTVPATAVLDRAGAVRAINHGFADEARLSAQLRALAAPER